VFAIITTANQMDEVAQYADWTDRRGYPTIVVDVATILSSTPGRNNAEKVFNWIKDHYQLGLSFVLFLGHESEIPYRYLYCNNLAKKPDPPYPPTFIPSDLYFSSVSRAVSPGCAFKPLWDCDEDQVYGEPGPQNGLPLGDAGSWDHYPEVFVGRVLAYTDHIDNDPNEAQNWLTKTLKYEKDPGNKGFLTGVKFVSDVYPCPSCEDIKGHYSSRYYFSDLYYKPAWEVMDTLSTKPCGWVNIYTHGEPTIFWTKTAAPRDSILSVPDEAGPPNLSEDLMNQDKYFLVYDIACWQEAFENEDSLDWTLYPPYRLSDTTVSEAFVEANSLKGAIAFLGNTRPGVFGAYGGSFDLHRAFLDYIFGPLALSNRFLLGVPEAYSRAQANIMLFVAREHNLLGSPLIDIWDTINPRIIYIQHPNPISSGPQNFTVRALTSLKPVIPLGGAMVCLKGCNVYNCDMTNVNGYAYFYINPQGPGIITVTTTKHNHKPRESDCQVLGKGSLATSEVGDMPVELSLKAYRSRGQVRIAYAIPFEDEGRVSLKVYDVTGRETDNLVDAETQSGWYEQVWEPPASGTYILVLRTWAKVLTCRVVSIGR
ncbi:MAG: C25 family cysteine peptidase, partial [Candidatus Hydrothermia bacterium]